MADESEQQRGVEAVADQEEDVSVCSTCSDTYSSLETLPSLMGPDDPMRMALTEEEEGWALNVKRAIEGTPELDNSSDFTYAQLGLICKENTEEAIRKAYGLQAFRREYNILDTYEQGCQSIRAMSGYFPEHFLSFGFCHQNGTYVLVHDLSKADTQVLTSPRMVENYFVASYYLHTGMSPDMESIRKGSIVLVECARLDWTKKPNFKIIQKLFSQLLAHYPFTGHARCYHTGLFFNLMAAMLRKILPDELKDRLKTGLVFEGTLSDVYLVPNAKVATERVLQGLEATLMRHYANETEFFLLDESEAPS